MSFGAALGANKTVNQLNALTQIATPDQVHVWDTSALASKKLSAYQLGAMMYFPDWGEADQGAASAGGNLTVKDFVDLAGSNNAIICLSNLGNVNADYRFQTAETIPSNITLHFQRGARLDPDSGITVTVNSPSHIDAVDSQEIKTGGGESPLVGWGGWGTTVRTMPRLFRQSSTFWRLRVVVLSISLRVSIVLHPKSPRRQDTFIGRGKDTSRLLSSTTSVYQTSSFLGERTIV
jgi:hypothetical protein